MYWDLHFLNVTDSNAQHLNNVTVFFVLKSQNLQSGVVTHKKCPYLLGLNVPLWSIYQCILSIHRIFWKICMFWSMHQAPSISEIMKVSVLFMEGWQHCLELV